jgi:hypothetical protein
MTHDSADDVADQGPVPTDAKPSKAVAMLPREPLRAVYIEMVYGEKGPHTTSDDKVTLLAKGTGFFYRVDGQVYLVTARHNLSGKHWETNQFLHTTYSVAPTHVVVAFRAAPPKGGYPLDQPVNSHHYLLRLIDEAWQPIWREHPRYGRSVDVAALPFNLPDDQDLIVEAWDVDTTSTQQPSSKIWSGQDISIIGYPYGIRGSFDLPLWVRGAIASEPALMYEYRGREYPLFLVDSRTRTGQSGSAVVSVRQPFSVTPTPDGTQMQYSVSPQCRLLGVYTGRISDDHAINQRSAFGADPLPLPDPPAEPTLPAGEQIDAELERRLKEIARRSKPSSDLGFVWRIEEVAEICRGEVAGESGPADVDPGEVLRARRNLNG